MTRNDPDGPATVHVGRVGRVARGATSPEACFAACSCGWWSSLRHALGGGCDPCGGVVAAEQDWLDHVAAQPGAESLRRARDRDTPPAGRPAGYPVAGVSITRAEPGERPGPDR